MRDDFLSLSISDFSKKLKGACWRFCVMDEIDSEEASFCVSVLL